MELRELRHVATLARLLNFTKAAAELGISQPVLSRSIQGIEQRHRVRLFDRAKGRVYLTAAGRDFATRAGVALRQVQELEFSLRDAADAKIGDLVFGVSPIVSKVLLSKLIEKRLTAAPALTLKAAVRSHDVLFPLLEAEDIEFFISSKVPLPNRSAFREDQVGHFPVQPVVRPSHPLLNGSITKARFRRLTTISIAGFQLMPPSLAPYVEVDDPIVVEDVNALLGVVQSTDTIFIGTPFVAAEALRAGTLVPLPQAADEIPQRVPVVMYSLNGRTLSPSAVAVRRDVRAIFASMWREFQHLNGFAA